MRFILDGGEVEKSKKCFPHAVVFSQKLSAVMAVDMNEYYENWLNGMLNST